MSRKRNPELTPSLANQCRELVYRMAKKHKIPPVWITAHIRDPRADKARVETWREMLTRFQMGREQIATIFGRDRRRLRKSVIGV